MLPDFPNLKRRLLRLVEFDFRQRVQADGLMGAIKATPYYEGGRFAAGDVEGYVEETTPEVTAIPYEINRPAIIERGVDAFIESTRKAVALQIQALHEMLLRKVGEAADRVGNQFDAGGQPFSAELYFKMLETVQIDFDSQGRPDTSSTHLVMHPDQAARVEPLLAQWEADESFQRRYREVMLKKREEWRDRESNRKLVD
jgi:hypothetical protein